MRSALEGATADGFSVRDRDIADPRRREPNDVVERGGTLAVLLHLLGNINSTQRDGAGSLDRQELNGLHEPQFQRGCRITARRMSKPKSSEGTARTQRRTIASVPWPRLRKASDPPRRRPR